MNPYRAVIAPVPEGVHRPTWSVMIPTYNCASLLRETLSSVLAQAPGPERMQIEVVDDHSTADDPRAVVEELGRGRVAFYRQPENVGFIRNFETCLQRSRGRLVHLLHGDDYVREGFYEKLERAFEQPETGPEVGAAFCRHLYMDENSHWLSLSLLERAESGVIEGWLEKIAAGQRVATPSIVVRREVYEKLGGFDRRMVCAGEDWEMWVRIAAAYPVWFEAEPLAAYRVKRAGSLTEGASRTNKLVRDMRRATEIIESYLPNHLPRAKALELTGRARELYASWALQAARQRFAAGDLAAVQAEIGEALRCSASSKTKRAAARLLAAEGCRWGMRKLRAGPRRLLPRERRRLA